MEHVVEELEHNRAGLLGPRQQEILAKNGLEMVMRQGNSDVPTYGMDTLRAVLERGSVTRVKGHVAYDSDRLVPGFNQSFPPLSGKYGAFVEGKRASFAFDELLIRKPLPGPYMFYVVYELNLVMGFEPIEWTMEQRWAQYRVDILQAQGLTEAVIEANERGEVAEGQKIRRFRSFKYAVLAIFELLFGLSAITMATIVHVVRDFHLLKFMLFFLLGLGFIMVGSSHSLLAYRRFMTLLESLNSFGVLKEIGEISVWEKEKHRGTPFWEKTKFFVKITGHEWHRIFSVDVIGLLYPGWKYKVYVSTASRDCLALVPVSR